MTITGHHTYNEYERWLDSTGGLNPHKTNQDGVGFNNIVNSTHLLLGKIELGIDTKKDSEYYFKHIRETEDENGLYMPKNSHDNLTAKLAGLLRTFSAHVTWFDLKEAQKGKHPRDRIFYGCILKGGLYWLLFPFVMFEIIRGIYDQKVRPKFWETKDYKFRLYEKLGWVKPEAGKKLQNGVKYFYTFEGEEKYLLKIQNDGKILNLHRLNILREYKLLRPFVRLCKRLYIKELGPNFQSVMFEKYYGEYNYPVRSLYRELDKQGKTIIDC